MKSDAVFGRYVPGTSPLHRLPAGGTYLLVLLPTLLTIVAQNVWLSLAVLAADIVLLRVARLPVRAALGLGWGFLIMVGLLVAYNAWFVSLTSAVVVGATIVAGIYGSRLLVMTTPGPDLIDALVAAARPLRRVGLPPERFALAVAIMLRSIPYLVGSFADVRDAARARGQQRRIVGQVTPVVVEAVAYAHRTGEALVARGLGDD